MLSMSNHFIHAVCTGIILLQNILVRCDVVSVPTHCATALLYTLVDVPFLPMNPRGYSVAIHHAATLYLLLGAIQHDEYINSTDLMMLESTTFFSMLYKLIPNGFTKRLRNVSWLLVRLVFLPMYVVYEVYKASKHRYDVFLDYSHALVTLMVLSLEWTNEVLKTNFPYFSMLYYIVPLIQLTRMRAYVYVGMLMASASLSVIREESTRNRFEDRLLFRGVQTYAMTRFVHLQ